MQNTTPENLILLCGELITDGTFSCLKNGEEFYQFLIKITLPTGVDVLPVLIPKGKLDETVQKGCTISLTGKVVSEEAVSGEEHTLILKVAAEEIYAGETEITSGVFLTGNVIKKPYSYTIENGQRAEFQLAVGEDVIAYVPVAVGGENADVAKGLQLGDTVSVLGQLHSYEYLDLNGDSACTKTAYEVEILAFTALPKI